MLEFEKDKVARSAISILLASERAMLVFDSRHRNGGFDLDSKQRWGPKDEVAASAKLQMDQRGEYRALREAVEGQIDRCREALCRTTSG
jgi:hypothetical protein